MRQNPQRLGDGVFAVDTEHVRRQADASYLIIDGGRAAFVDTGTQRSVPNLLAAIGALDVERVDYVLLTHVHLDHAGGAGGLIAALPRARVVVHPRGAAHLTDPAKLLAIDAVAHIARAVAAAPDRLQRIERELFAHLTRRLQAHGFAGDETARHALLDGDVTLNAAGLDAWLRRAA